MTPHQSGAVAVLLWALASWGPCSDAIYAQPAAGAPPADTAADDPPATDDPAAARPELELLDEARWPKIEVAVTPGEGVAVGDAVTITLTIQTADGDRIAIPEQSFAPFELLDTEREEIVDQGASGVRLRASLLALEPGDHTLAVHLRVLTHDHELGRVPVHAITIPGRSLIANEPNAMAEGFSDPHQVYEEDFSVLWGALGLLALVVVSAIAFFAGRWWLRRDRAQRPALPPRPPWEVAFEQLELLRRELTGNGNNLDQVGFADGLSDTLRDYLGQRYGFEGLESTTAEIVAQLRKRRPKAGVVEEVASLLGDLDLVKFAKAVPTADQGQVQLDSGYRIVMTTKPPIESQSAPTGQPEREPA